MTNNSDYLVYTVGKKGGRLMRVYSIFHIKREHQSFIFGRERMLLEMISTLEQTAESSVSKELSYLCEPIEGKMLKDMIYKQLQKRFPTIDWIDDRLKFEHHLKGRIEMRVFPYHLEALCEGSRMLDLDLFQCLSQMNDSFIAFNKEEMECGWLKPMKYYSC